MQQSQHTAQVIHQQVQEGDEEIKNNTMHKQEQEKTSRRIKEE